MPELRFLRNLARTGRVYFFVRRSRTVPKAEIECRELQVRGPMMKMTNLLLAAALITMPDASFAQTTYSQRHHVAARKGNQQARVANGVASGQLTPRETGRIEHQESSINREE